MGIETFFSALAGATRKKHLMTPFTKQHADAILFDFNSIIHRTSQILVEDLNRAMRRLYSGHIQEAIVLCQKYRNISQEAQRIVEGEVDPAVLASININKIVIKAVVQIVNDYVAHLEDCKLVYLAMDGVPGYGKMREQKHRRYLGEVSATTASKISKKYMNTFPKIGIDYPYDYKEYYAHKLSFSKSQITPGTQFMRDLCAYIRASTPGRAQWILSDFDEFGEGEMKIIDIMHTETVKGKDIIVYSPDADMILLCLLEQERNTEKHIKLLRYDQRTNTDTIVDIITLRMYMEEHGNVEDLIFLFSVFGDDFVPRLEAMSARDHLILVLDLYKKHLHSERILTPDGVNIKQLIRFFELLEPYERVESVQYTKKRSRRGRMTRRRGGGYRRMSTYIQEPTDGPIINALHEEIHIFMNMEGKYAANQRKFSQSEFYKYYGINHPQDAAMDYLRGLEWLRNYYYDGIFVTHWVYGYEKAPFIKDILCVLRKLTKLPGVPEDPSDVIMNPMEHLIYVSPGDVSNEAPDSSMAEYVKDFYKRIGLPPANWTEKVIVDCTNSPYRSKCRMIHVDVPLYKMKPYEYLQLFRSSNSSTYLVLLMASA